jgi:hypothetical protein
MMMRLYGVSAAVVSEFVLLHECRSCSQPKLCNIRIPAGMESKKIFYHNEAYMANVIGNSEAISKRDSALTNTPELHRLDNLTCDHVNLHYKPKHSPIPKLPRIPFGKPPPDSICVHFLLTIAAPNDTTLVFTCTQVIVHFFLRHHPFLQPLCQLWACTSTYSCYFHPPHTNKELQY